MALWSISCGCIFLGPHSVPCIFRVFRIRIPILVGFPHLSVVIGCFSFLLGFRKLDIHVNIKTASTRRTPAPTPDRDSRKSSAFIQSQSPAAHAAYVPTRHLDS
jgi:hypothetical protein